MAGVVFADPTGKVFDLTSKVFDDSKLYSATFVRCNLTGTTFRNACIGNLRFVDCQPGAVFDTEPKLLEDAEVVLVGKSGRGDELYVSDEIKKALNGLAGSGASQGKIPAPQNIVEKAVVIIFQSLYKSDKKHFDYPEPKKIENRLRAWLANYDLNQQKCDQFLRGFMDLYRELEKESWICANPNRPRTRAPCAARAQDVSAVVQGGKLPVHLQELRKLASKFQQRVQL